jgi:hypothetical protein
VGAGSSSSVEWRTRLARPVAVVVRGAGLDAADLTLAGLVFLDVTGGVSDLGRTFALGACLGASLFGGCLEVVWRHQV